MEHGSCTLKTSEGRTIECNTWKESGRINFTIYVDGVDHTSGTSDDDFGRSTAEMEAELQCKMLAEEISA